MNDSKKLLVFGPQALNFTPASFKNLRIKLQSDPVYSWAIDIFQELPSAVKLLHEELSSITKDQIDTLELLGKALKTGDLSDDVFPLSNTLLSPLVVASQLADYVGLLKAMEPNLTDTSAIPYEIKSNAETLGLCTGLLGAFSVACSSNLQDLKRYGAVAIKLAALTGAVVDSENQKSKKIEGSSVSFSVSWATGTASEVDTVLKRFPNSYISVQADNKRATITCSEKDVSQLQQQLKTAGFNCSNLALKGRFHWASHKGSAEKLISLINRHESLQLLDASQTIIPAWGNNDSKQIKAGNLHELAVRAILMDQSSWFQTVTSALDDKLQDSESKIICFGSERCIPPTIARQLDTRLLQLADIDLTNPSTDSLAALFSGPDDRIAVIGMSCHVPNAEDLESFWDILLSGESQHREVPTERFSMDSFFREVDPKRKWYGNFIRDPDVFDHKFFKKSPREMSSTDPQHRVALQLAYQAVQQSGYFGVKDVDKHIGVYIGHANTDYEHNIRCYPANAYSATGNLKSLLSGRISHYFGWTGPSMSLDTACSSSSVAVHLACRAILSGEISGALAGGVNILTSPEWYHNLAGASFLSPTGQCKSFDARGDGYCRGEGSGLVLLKKLSKAISDGDQILGVIAGTSVLQNQNCTPITVPNSISLSDLFRSVIKRSRINPWDITVVEAHGTGTAVGDPAEYDGIRQVLGGPARPNRLALTAVKGSIGHLEVASGVASLIKVLLMIHEAAIPPQASFQSPNPDLKIQQDDNMDISTKVKPWEASVRAALINNYGASGSNASMVVTEAPKKTFQRLQTSASDVKNAPFFFTGLDDSSLKNYTLKFQKWLQRKRASDKTPTLANLSFQLARQSNQTLTQALALNATSIEDLDSQISLFNNGTGAQSFKRSSSRPVILVFGGQVSKFVGLDENLYDNVTILRQNLDRCNAICLDLGLESIYPAIFQQSPIEDVVKLQVCLFAAQYSCASAWIESGVEVSAIVGHSFGELTGLCVSGVLSLKDSLRLISGRAKAIKESWTTEKGSMMAAEGDIATIESLVTVAQEKSGSSLSIACYNGPRSFTLGGTAAAIKTAEDLATNDTQFSGVRVKKLNVTNAFHSSLVDSLEEELRLLGRSLNFKESKIPLEHAMEDHKSGPLEEDFVFNHLRRPVYFRHAVERLSGTYPDAIWLEAGSNSTVAAMANKALPSAKASFFQSVNLGTENSYSTLVDITLKLFKEGLDVNFWAHHKSQIAAYTPLLLPPYQFERSRHWLDIKTQPVVTEQAPAVPAPVPELDKNLITFIGYVDDKQTTLRFRVNTKLPEFTEMVDAHIMANTTPVMPGMYPVEIAILALSSIRPEFQNFQYQPELQNMVYYSPMIPSHCRELWFDAHAVDAAGLVWDWTFTGTDSKGNATKHISASLVFQQPQSSTVQADFARLSRFGGHKRCKRLLDGLDVDDVVVGRNIYRAFESVIDYRDLYRHVTKLVGKDGDSAGRVVLAHGKESWLDSVLTDCFCQVAGVAVNLFSDTADFTERGVYIGDRVDRWIRAPGLRKDPAQPKEWDVFAVNHRESDSAFVSDVFAFDARDGSLYEAVLGIRYSKVTLTGIRKALNRALADTPAQGAPQPVYTAPTSGVQMPTFNSLPAAVQEKQAYPTTTMNGFTNGTNGVSPSSGTSSTQETPSSTTGVATPASSQTSHGSSDVDVSGKAKQILNVVAGVEVTEIQDDSDLVEMGIDSLMAMELIREVDNVFKITLDTDQLMAMTDFKSLVVCISKTIGVDSGANGASTAAAIDEVPQINGHGNLPANGINGTNGTSNHGQTNGHHSTSTQGKSLPETVVLDVFRATKAVTDEFIVKHNMADYYTHIRPKSTMLCAMYIVEAFEKLGCSLRSARPGERLATISYLPKHEKFMKELYKIIGPQETGFVEILGDSIIRTDTSIPTTAASELLAQALREVPDHAPEFKLSALTGCKLAECLTGKQDGLQIIFGSAEGRKTVSDVYAVAPVNYTWIAQASFFLQQLINRLPSTEEPIKILEMGSGTGGTTATIVPMLASLGVPITYTFTDLSSSLVAAARKRFKQYPFMQFKVLDIEAAIDPSLQHTQHIVLANACVHATRSLPISLKNIHDVLRSDGMVMLLEETEQLPWVDFVFGLLEGWWLFNDGRTHAQCSAEHWEKVLRGAGFGHVDYTDGQRREAQVQRIIFGFASDIRYAHGSVEPSYPQALGLAELMSLTDRQKVIDDFTNEYSLGLQRASEAASTFSRSNSLSDDWCVLVTGGTGSLGSHVMWYAAQLPQVRKVIALNRLGTSDALSRQKDSFTLRGLELDADLISKLEVVETDASLPSLGLSSSKYNNLLRSVTHIVHSAWPMSLTRPTKAYANQFQVLQNLMTLAQEVSSLRPSPFKFSFQFISSIGAVGFYPIWTGLSLAPEDPTTADTALPVGYADAKLVCERILEKTLRLHPARFRAMSVRIAQITGSRTNGYWNPMEHFSFFVKSAQQLKSLPDLKGTLSWSPVNDVARSLLDILFSTEDPYCIYHIENPKRQPWPDMIQLLSSELQIPTDNIVPYQQWLQKVRNSEAPSTENPAKQLMDFWEKHFLRMSTGELILSTEHSREHSRTMRESGPVEEELTRKYIGGWKRSGFLKG